MSSRRAKGAKFAFPQCKLGTGEEDSRVYLCLCVYEDN